MKNLLLIITFFVVLFNNYDSSLLQQEGRAYYGQKPPGNIGEIFADGTIANSQHSFHTNIIFNKNGTEAYWHKYDRNRALNVIVYSKLENGKWIAPVQASFSLNNMGDDAPFMSPDGKRFYFISKRPVDASTKKGKQNIWFSERNGKEWSQPQPIPGEVNSMPGIHWQFSVDADYNLYLSCCEDIYSAGRTGSIFYSKYSNGFYQKPVQLPNSINAPDEYNATPFVSPDGSYLIFSRESPKTQKMQIFFSRRNNGNWNNAVSISDYIGEFSHNCPIVTSDGKYLFFLRYVNSFTQPFWIDSSFIVKLK